MKYVIGLLILGFVGYTIYPLVLGGRHMESFCESIQVGDSEVDVLARALDSGYTKLEVAEHGQLLLIDSRAMGRYICDVSISNGEVAGSRYVFND
jgi:hypothetical protein